MIIIYNWLLTVATGVVCDPLDKIVGKGRECGKGTTRAPVGLYAYSYDDNE